ncbi:MAG TPA: M28 family peptidase [Terriglobia bacterium]|nr:M28 family peptidase [Terriglobia bacterium]
MSRPKPKRLAAWACLMIAAVVSPARAKSRAAATNATPSFNGSRAFEDLRRLVGFGARPSGSNQLALARQWMLGELKKTGAEIEEDKFVATTPIGQLAMDNLIAKLPGTKPDIVIIAGHYDTARIPNVNFVGANDGGSSAALLMELARAVSGRKYPFTLWLVFFDGEEAAHQWTDTDSLYGSRHFLARLSDSGNLGRVKAMILVDMIGDAKLRIYRDENSTQWLNDLVFSTAKQLGYAKNFLDAPLSVTDDHMPFVNAGVSAVDLLGNVGPPSPSSSFGAYWHSAKDTVEHCSATSLGIVGRVVLASLNALGRQPR